MTTPSHHEIAARAYALWQNAGSPAGRDFEFWILAEAELATRAARIEVAVAAPRPAAPAKRAKRKQAA